MTVLLAFILTVLPVSPAQGQQAMFSGTFPKAAFAAGHGSQFHLNPIVDVNCGTWRVQLQVDKGSRNSDGSINGTAGPVTVDAAAGSLCQAVSGYWTADKSGVHWNSVASTTFTVG